MLDRVRAVFQDARPESVVAAYLYGSHAEGRAPRESDVDVAVLLDRAPHPSRFDLRVEFCSAVIAATSRNAVDVVVLNDVSPELGRRVVTSGVRVYCTDAAAEHALVRDVQLRAADRSTLRGPPSAGGGLSAGPRSAPRRFRLPERPGSERGYVPTSSDAGDHVAGRSCSRSR